MRPTFLTDWETVVESPINNRGNQQGGTLQTGDCLQPRGGGNQGDGRGNPYQQGAQYQQECKPTPAFTSPREARHPKIKALMDPLLAKDFCILVKTLCQACNTPMYEFSGLPKYRDSTGQSTICWNNLLKGCGLSECPLKHIGGHVPRKDITNVFANAVCNKLSKGVTYLINNHCTPYEPPPAKKPKTAPAPTLTLQETDRSDNSPPGRAQLKQ